MITKTYTKLGGVETLFIGDESTDCNPHMYADSLGVELYFSPGLAARLPSADPARIIRELDALIAWAEACKAALTPVDAAETAAARLSDEDASDESPTILPPGTELPGQAIGLFGDVQIVELDIDAVYEATRRRVMAEISERGRRPYVPGSDTVQ